MILGEFHTPNPGFALVWWSVDPDAGDRGVAMAESPCRLASRP